MLNVHRNTLFLCCALPCSPGLAAACSLCAAAWGRAEVSRVGVPTRTEASQTAPHGLCQAACIE